MGIRLPRAANSKKLCPHTGLHIVVLGLSDAPCIDASLAITSTFLSSGLTIMGSHPDLSMLLAQTHANQCLQSANRKKTYQHNTIHNVVHHSIPQIVMPLSLLLFSQNTPFFFIFQLVQLSSSVFQLLH